MALPIKVLLVDDKEDYCKSLSGAARHKNIQIVYTLDWETGFDILKNDPLIDFVILDGKGKVESDQSIEHESFAMKAMKDIDVYGVKINKLIPYCLNTGYVDSFSTFQGNVTIFEKTDAQRGKLFDYITEQVSNSELINFKNKYSNQILFSTNNYIGSKHFDRIIGLIKDIEYPNNIKIAQDSLTGVRKIIEASFIKLNEIGCVPDAIINGQGWINGSGLFLSSRHRDYDYKQDIIHPVIAFNIHKILTITQDGSHDQGSNLGVDAYMAVNNNTFLYQSIVLLLLDTLDYLKRFIDNNSDKTGNESKWSLKIVQQTVVNFEGIIKQDHDNNYYCDKYHLNYGYVNGKFNIGQKIKITEEDINTNPKTKHLYSHYAVKFETI